MLEYGQEKLMVSRESDKVGPVSMVYGRHFLNTCRVFELLAIVSQIKLTCRSRSTVVKPPDRLLYIWFTYQMMLLELSGVGQLSLGLCFKENNPLCGMIHVHVVDGRLSYTRINKSKEIRRPTQPWLNLWAHGGRRKQIFRKFVGNHSKKEMIKNTSQISVYGHQGGGRIDSVLIAVMPLTKREQCREAGEFFSKVKVKDSKK